MKIAVITPLAYPPMVGGCELHANKLFEEFIKIGDGVNIFTTNARHYHQLSEANFISSKLPYNEKANGLNIYRFPLSKKLKKVASCLINKKLISLAGIKFHLECGPLFSKKIFFEIGKKKPDLIVSMNMMGTHNWYAWLMAQYLKIPFVFFPLLHLKADYPYFLSSKFMLKRADLVVANTNYEKDIIESLFRGKPPKVIVGGVGPTISQKCEKGSSKQLIVGYIGRLDSGKGCECLIKSMVSVWLKKPKVKLILAGRETAFTKKIEDEVKKLPWGFDKKVFIYKNISEKKKASLLREIDVFVMVSKLESFGISYLDAWKMGCSTIALKSGPQKEVFDNGRCGLLVDEFDIFSTSESIMKLLSSERLRQQQVGLGLEKINKMYNWKTIALSLRKEFNNLLS